MIQLKQLSKQYGEIVVFEQLNFNCGVGEIIAIKGKSGSGKSTLLNILAGLEKASSGTYQLDGESLEQYSLHKLAKIRGQKIGYISQFSPMIQHITVIENMYLPLLILEPKRKQISEGNRQKIESLSEKFKIKHLWKKKINKLSGGEIQRVGIIRALMGNPTLLIADEPTGSLDDETAGIILSFFKSLKEQGMTTILATHSSEIAAQCDEVYILNEMGLSKQ